MTKKYFAHLLNLFNRHSLEGSQQDKKDAYKTSLNLLLKKEGVTSDDIKFNGFSQFQIYFSNSRILFENDPEVATLLSKVDKLAEKLEKKYQME